MDNNNINQNMGQQPAYPQPVLQPVNPMEQQPVSQPVLQPVNPMEQQPVPQPVLQPVNPMEQQPVPQPVLQPVNPMEQQPQLMPMGQAPIQQPMQDTQQNIDEILLRSFIGEKYDSFLSSKFNIFGFFFNIMYMFYRKMLLFGLGIFIVIILLQFTPIPTSILFAGLNIVLGFTVNKIYLFYVKKKIESIKKKNPNVTQEQLMEICSKKGGTSVGLCILGFFVEVILAFIIIMATLFAMLSSFLVSLGISPTEIKIEDGEEEIEPYEELFVEDVEGDTKKVFSVVPPPGFGNDEASVDYLMDYTYYEADGTPTCNFSISAAGETTFTPQQIISSFGEFNDLKGITHSPTEEASINSVNWAHMTLEEEEGKSIYCVTVQNGKAYYLIYSIPSTNNTCASYIEQTMQGITLK